MTENALKMHAAACSSKALGVNLGDKKDHGTNSCVRFYPEIFFITSLLSNDCFSSISLGLHSLSPEACSPGVKRDHAFDKSGTHLQSLRPPQLPLFQPKHNLQKKSAWGAKRNELEGNSCFRWVFKTRGKKKKKY